MVGSAVVVVLVDDVVVLLVELVDVEDVELVVDVLLVDVELVEELLDVDPGGWVILPGVVVPGAPVVDVIGGWVVFDG